MKTEIEPKNIPKNCLILDIRSIPEYLEIHLNRPHWHIPCEELNVKDFLTHYKIPNDEPLYILSKNENQSMNLIEKLKDQGFENTIHIKGGITRAKEQGLETISHHSWSMKRKFSFWAGILIFSGTLLSLFVSKTFYLIPLGIGFILILQSILGKPFISYIQKK